MIRHYNQYYDAFYILFKTGLRISEFCGLTVKDLDFKEEYYQCESSVQRTREMKYIIVSTKTTSGTRLLPMEADVKEAFLRILKNRRKPKREPMVDGYEDFCFWTRMEGQWLHFIGKSTCSMQEKNIIVNICCNCRQLLHIYEAYLLYKYGQFRDEPKTLQYLMGHSDVSVTLNIYTHTGYDDAKKELARLKEARDELEKKKFITQKHAQTTHVSLIS